jgi:DNA polymerase alpha subunit A
VVSEIKGLDMVRRDWCPLSKRIGNFVLSEILSDKNREDIIMALNEFLTDIGQKMKDNELTINEYIITKQLTRAPESYSDVKSLPHVQIALRMQAAGKSNTELINNFIPYIICAVIGEEEAKGGKKQQKHLADKAYSPDELIEQKGKLEIDTQYYITQQIMPPITRLIEHIDGINIDFVAQCLGVDPTKYKYSSGKGNDHDAENDPNVHNAILKTETQKQLKDRSIARFTMCCPNPNCGVQFEFPGVFQTSNKNGISGMQCEDCKEVVPHKFIKNKIQLFLRHLLEVYYEGKFCVT